MTAQDSFNLARTPKMAAIFSNLVLVLLCSVAVIISSCQKDPDDSLRGCCINTAIDVSFGNGYLYMPNIFTPDGDGINDVLVMCTDSVALINKIEIENRSGKVVFEATNVPPNDPATRWDGRVDGTIQKGVYKIHVTATAADGTTTSATKNVCNYPCANVPADEYVNSILCQFGDQVDPDCEYSGVFPSAEPFDCFK
jgi:hypothetical protein